MICAAQRSGSSYFCQLLTSTQQLGHPMEYFNTPGMRRSNPKYPTDPEAQFKIVRSIGATENGIYAVKVLGYQLRRISEKADPFHMLPRLELVRLKRHDLLGQAISLSRAKQTGQYWSLDVQRGTPVYSEARIRACLRSVQEQETIWDQIIGRLGQQPLVFEYQDIVQHPQSAIDRVAALMGVEGVRIKPELIRSRVQRDEISFDWRQRFLSDTGDEFQHLIAQKPVQATMR